ncbi:MAG: GAF domain-containing protein [Planctomycetes bacterium]|nr:GAF domain-containing protein [Planctomycetota bacterium]
MTNELDVLGRIVAQRPQADSLRGTLESLVRKDQNDFLDKLSALLVRMSSLLEVSRNVSDSMSVNVLLGRLTGLVMEFLDSERCTIFLRDRRTGELYTRASGDPLMSCIRFPSDRGIAGAVFTSGTPLLIPDAYADPRFNPAVDRATGYRTRNILCVPIRCSAEAGGVVIGVAQVLNKRSGPFDDRDVEVLAALTAQASSAFVNAQLHEEVVRAREEESKLLEVTSALARELQLEPLLQKIMESVKGILDAEKATLFMYDPKKKELWARVAEDAALQNARFPADQGLLGSTFARRETVNVADAYLDPRFSPEMDQLTHGRTRSILSMPVVNRDDQVSAVIQVLNKKGGVFTASDEDRLRGFCAQASIALQNAQHFEDLLSLHRYNEGILESMTNGVITLDADGRIVKANRAALRLTGLESAPQAMLGRAAREFFDGDNAWVVRSIEAMERQGEPQVAVDVELALSWSRRATSTPASSAGREAGGGAREVGDGPVGSASLNLTVVPLGERREARAGCLLLLEDLTREKRLRSTMARYMSKELADRLLAEGEGALGGKVLRATILFSDIRDFTQIAERIGPQGTVGMLNSYFSRLVDVVLEKGGVLDKYIGDALMAVFGVPFAGPEDADHAVDAAVGMLRAIRPLNRSFAAEGRTPLVTHIGINTGEVVSGNIGSPKRMEYTVVGDGVNLASRLEGANKRYGTEILATEFTVGDFVKPHRTREIDRIRVKGKTQPVGIFEILDGRDEESFPRMAEVLAAHHAGLASYRARDWTRARVCFADAGRLHPGDEVSKLYVGRCEHFLREAPPEDWDGVWTFHEK